MTLDAMLLQKLSEWKPGRGRQTLNLTDAASGWTVSLAADRCDELRLPPLCGELNLRAPVRFLAAMRRPCRPGVSAPRADTLTGSLSGKLI